MKLNIHMLLLSLLRYKVTFMSIVQSRQGTYMRILKLKSTLRLLEKKNFARYQASKSFIFKLHLFHLSKILLRFLLRHYYRMLYKKQ